MFKGCTNLTAAPALPATTLAENCYYSMFYGCTNLNAAPELSATTLAKSCCSDMFRNCTSLTAAPELLAETLAESCYAFMFNGCSNLNYIKVHFTAWGSGRTAQWVKGVSATGTFYCPSGLPNTSGTSNIPTDWTKVNLELRKARAEAQAKERRGEVREACLSRFLCGAGCRDVACYVSKCQ